jgi:protein-arginine kinase
MIVSTRIRVGRNLAEFPLGPGISKAQRDQVETTVSEVLKTFTGDLAGSYYALNKLSEAERNQLVADHFLFKEGDRFLESCGLNRDWPSGRGIFHNKEKTFLVWINEEDQLRIISMQPGADILAVFTRLSKAAAEIEKKAKFAHDEHLGYITSCPTNLGTALRASVHIKLPFLSKDKAQFNKIADQFYVQIRGIHGEHSESDDGTYDISNKRRLGRSEVDLVQDMYNGLKAMIEAEKKLAPAASAPVAATTLATGAAVAVKAGPHLKKPEDITGFVEFPEGTKSLLSKYLTKEIYDKYKGKKDKAGVSFEQMILSGSQNIDSGIGLYAGSHDSYTTFSDLFDKVIEDYHKHNKTAKHVSDMDFKTLKCPPLSAEDAKMIVSTRIRVGRNLAEFPLGPGISKEQRDKVETLV